ncbi:MAG: TolC family protein [Bacteroidales bacterium]|nr:TolC family protein [Bacteroidales bacterium]
MRSLTMVLKKKATYIQFQIILILLVFSFQMLPAQEEPTKLTLQDAIDIARQQSPDALIARHTFLSSYWGYRSYMASYLPYLAFDGTLPEYRSSISPEIQGGSTIYNYTNENTLSGNLSLNQQIGFTGGNVSVSSGLLRVDDFNEDTSYFVSNLVNIAYTQPLFQYNRMKWERKIEPVVYEEAKKKYIEDMEQTSITATNHFFNLLLAQIEKEIAVINQANYDTLYKIAQGRYNLGKIAENDLLQLELQFLRSNSNVKEKELNFENQLFNFKSFLRIKEDYDIELIIPDDFKKVMVQYAKAVEQARYNNSTVLGFHRRLLEAERDLANAKYSERFNADITARYGIDNNAQFLDDLTKDPSDLRIFTLGVSVPILDWGVTRGKIKQAESKQELVRTAVEQEQIDFDQEVFLLVSRFNMQYDQVKIAAKADTVAQKGYNITKARYLIGKISITDLNIAQAESNSSKGNYIQALWTYWRNYYQLRKLTLYDFERDQPIVVNYKELL